MSVTSGIDESGVVVVDSAGSKEFDDVVMTEATEWELVGVASEFFELRPAGLVELIARSGRDDHQRVRRGFGVGEEACEQHRGVVAEMDVVEDDDDRPAGVEFGEHGAESCEPVLGCIGGEEVLAVADRAAREPDAKATALNFHPNTAPRPFAR